MEDESRETGPQRRKELDSRSSEETGDVSSSGTSEEKRETSSRELGPQRRKDLESRCSEETGDVSSSGTSEEPSEASTRDAGPAYESLSPHTSGSSSVAEGKSELPPDSTKADKSTSKVTAAFAKWDSPPKTKESTKVISSPKEYTREKSPDKRGKRFATITSGGKKIASKITVASKKFTQIFHSSKPSDSDEASLIKHDAASQVSGEGPSSQKRNEPQPQIRVRPPKFAEMTGQEGGHLSPKVSMCQDSFDDSTTEVTRLSGSVSLGDKEVPSDPSYLDSREGSTGDDSSLEREFDELYSPSKSAQQGLKRSKAVNESSDSENEDRVALGLCGSPRKRVELKKPDPGAGTSKEDTGTTD